MDSKEEIFVSEEEKARMASWNSMPYGKLELVAVPNKISTEQAHEVAMAAAQAAARVQTYSSTTIGAEVAQAYLQAYEAVEDWTKPLHPEVASFIDKSDKADMTEAHRKAAAEQVRGSKPNSMWVP